MHLLPLRPEALDRFRQIAGELAPAIGLPGRERCPSSSPRSRDVSASIARRDLVLLTLAAASWGVGTVVSKRAVEEIPPFMLLPLQLAASLGVLLILMRVSGMRLRGSPPILSRLEILNPGIAYALGLAGLT